MLHAFRPIVLRIDVLSDLASLIFVFLLLGWSILNQRIIEQVHLLSLRSCSALRFLHRLGILFLFNFLTLNVVNTVRVADGLCWEEPLITIARIDLNRVLPDLIPCFLKLTLGDGWPHLHISDRVMADAPTLIHYHLLISSWTAQLRWIQTSSSIDPEVWLANDKVNIRVNWAVRGIAVRAEVCSRVNWHAGILARRLRTITFTLTTCSEAIDIGGTSLLSGTRHALILIREKHSGRTSPTAHLRYALMRAYAGHARDTSIIAIDDLRCRGYSSAVLQFV